ncbi:Ctr copper transporter [Tylopilus felleus]
MDNSMGNSSSMNTTTSMSMSMSMIPWLHFGNADAVLFDSWRPLSHSAIAGACIGLFLFAILERSFAAFRRTQETRWRARAVVVSSDGCSSTGKLDPCEAPAGSAHGQPLVPPFRFSHDIPRGVIQAIQSTFAYALMLVVMTYNGAYIISIILGLGVGEILFGRMGRDREVDIC